MIRSHEYVQPCAQSARIVSAPTARSQISVSDSIHRRRATHPHNCAPSKAGTSVSRDIALGHQSLPAMTSNSAGIHESASTRALGMYDVVASIASYSPVWHDPDMKQEDWEASGLLARGVNKVWREAFDAHIDSCVIQSNGILRVAVVNETDTFHQVPLPVLRILSSSDRCRAVNAICAILPRAKDISARLAGVLVTQAASGLQKLGLDIPILPALSSEICRLGRICFPNLQGLALLLQNHHLDIELDASAVRAASRFLSTLTNLSTLHLDFEEEDGGREGGIFCWQTLYLLLSIPATNLALLHLAIRSFRAIDSASLASILSHFAPAPSLELDLEDLSEPMQLDFCFPATLPVLKCSGGTSQIRKVLNVLADPRQLPMLQEVPEIVQTDKKSRMSYQAEPVSAITARMVAKVIVGLEKRGTIDNVRAKAQKLFELVDA